MSNPTILLVDDEPDLVWAVRHSLIRSGFEVFTAGDGQEALDVARRYNPTLVILDIIMPILDGLEVCRRIRQDPSISATPILFLTARKTIEDRVIGLQEGGDDYLIKPFDLKELNARVHALLRRVKAIPNDQAEDDPEDSRLVAGAITLDKQTRQVWVGDKVAELTPTEFDLLYFLMIHPGRIFNSQQLLQQVWDYPAETADIGLVRWHIRNLRAKVEANPEHPAHILTIPRQGYMLERRNRKP